MPETAKLTISVSLDRKGAAEIKALGKTIKSVADKGVADFDRITEAVKKLSKQSTNFKDKSTSAAKKTSKALKKTLKDAKKLSQQLTQVGKDAESAGKKTSSSFQQATVSVSGFTVGLSVALVALGKLKDGVEFAAEFDDQLKIVQAATRATTDEFELLKKKALELGGEPGQTPAQIAKGMADLAKSGLDVNEVMESIVANAQLAASSELSFGDAVKAVVRIQSQFSRETKDAQDIVNVLITAASSAATTVTEIGQAYRKVGGVADSFNQSTNATGAALIAMAKSGSVATEGGTALRSVWSQLAKKSNELRDNFGVVVEVMQDGKKVIRPLADIIDDLADAELTAIERSALFGKIAGPGIAALLKVGGKGLRDYEQKLDDSAGAGERWGEILQSGLGGALRTIKSQGQDAVIRGVDPFIPALKLVAENAYLVSRGVSAMVGGFKTLTTGILGLVVLYKQAELAAFEFIKSGREALGLSVSDKTTSRIRTVTAELKAAKGQAEEMAGEAIAAFEQMAKGAGRAGEEVKATTAEIDNQRKAIQENEQATVKAESTKQAALAKTVATRTGGGEAAISLSVGYNKQDLELQIVDLKNKVEQASSELILKINADPAGAKEALVKVAELYEEFEGEQVLKINPDLTGLQALSAELDKLETELANKTAISDFDNQIRQLDLDFAALGKKLVGGFKLDPRLSDPGAAAGIKAQIVELRAEKLAIDGLIPGLELVNDTWQQIHGSVTDTKQPISETEELIKSLKLETKDLGFQTAATQKKLSKLAEAVSKDQLLTDQIAKLKKEIKDAGAEAEGTKEKLIAIEQAGVAQDILKKKISGLREEIKGTGDEAKKATEKIAETVPQVNKVTEAVNELAAANDNVADSAARAAAAQGSGKGVQAGEQTFTGSSSITDTSTVAGINAALSAAGDSLKLANQANEILFGRTSKLVDKQQDNSRIMQLLGQKFGLIFQQSKEVSDSNLSSSIDDLTGQLRENSGQPIVQNFNITQSQTVDQTAQLARTARRR